MLLAGPLWVARCALLRSRTLAWCDWLSRCCDPPCRDWFSNRKELLCCSCSWRRDKLTLGRRSSSAPRTPQVVYLRRRRTHGRAGEMFLQLWSTSCLKLFNTFWLITFCKRDEDWTRDYISGTSPDPNALTFNQLSIMYDFKVVFFVNGLDQVMEIHCGVNVGQHISTDSLWRLQ